MLLVAATLSLTVALAAATDYDADGDGAISRDEALAAVGEYLFDESITREEALEVVQAYLFALPVGPPAVVLSVDTPSVAGYWSDGTADVTGTLTLASEDDRPIVGDQAIEAVCAEPATCRWQIELLTDGLAEASASYRLRVPMGTTVVTFSYGQDEIQDHAVTVPERIIVSREAWDCYVDRELDPTLEDALGNKTFYGCSGWRAADAVHKVRGDAPIRLWVTSGDTRYTDLLRESLAELGKLLNLVFEWVDQQDDEVLNIYTGIPRDAWADHGLVDITEEDLEIGGWARSSTNELGEVTPQEIVIWQMERTWEGTTPGIAKSITLHELLHALTGAAHVATRPAAQLGYASSLPKLSPTDKALFLLNSHPLVHPGMTMQQVGALLTFEEDLLDYADLQPSALDMVWAAAIQLIEQGRARFSLSGGFTAGQGCESYRFATAHNPAALELSEFPEFLLTGAGAYTYSDATGSYRGAWNEEAREWDLWVMEDGEWVSLSQDTFREAVQWWVWPDKLLRTLYALIADWRDEAVTVRFQHDTVTLTTTLDESYRSWPTTLDHGYDLSVVLDAVTYEIEGYTLQQHPIPGRCVYEEIGYTE